MRRNTNYLIITHEECLQHRVDLSVAWQWVAWPVAAAAPGAAPCCCQHIVIILACDWTALITWPEYWAPIGRGVVNILSLSGRRGRGPLGTLYSACLDKHANKHINIQLGIFHAPWAEHTAVIRSPQPWSWGDILAGNPYLSWKPIFCSNIPYNSLIFVEFLWFSPQKSWI